MLIVDRIRAQGDLLFRHRSYLPFILVPLAAFAIWRSGATWERLFGARAEEALETLGMIISAAGAILRIVTVGQVPAGTSGRNTSGQRAETLNRTGLYSIVRNPLYLGNFLVFLGFALATEVLWFAVVSVLAFSLYYERIIAAEESYLVAKFGAVYEQWASVTPAFFPDFSRWRRSTMPFSWRTVIRREYNGILLIVVVFVGLEVGHDFSAHEATLTVWPADWTYYFAALAAVIGLYLPVRMLKHRSTLLHVPGR